MQRHEVINSLSNGKYQTYLEIGVEAGVTFNQVAIPWKVAVDPDFKIEIKNLTGQAYPITSDAYFAHHSDKLDCVFVDGLHLYEQSKADFVNAWQRLNTGGVVLIDDCYPSDEIAAIRDHARARELKAELGHLDRNWMGDVYKTAVWINDCTDYAYAFIEGTMGIVAVWQETVQNRPRWMASEAAIADCDYKTFCGFPLPKMTVDQIGRRIRGEAPAKKWFGLKL
jgi:hypothetical protein